MLDSHELKKQPIVKKKLFKSCFGHVASLLAIVDVGVSQKLCVVLWLFVELQKQFSNKFDVIKC